MLSIACYSEDKSYRCPAIGDVKDGTSEAEMLRKLGNPIKSSIKGVTKSVDYDDIGVALKLEKETVYYLLVGKTPMLCKSLSKQPRKRSVHAGGVKVYTILLSNPPFTTSLTL